MTSLTVGREPAAWRAVASAVATYETVALWTNLPTITRMNEKCPPLGAAILVYLTFHFYPIRRVR